MWKKRNAIFIGIFILFILAVRAICSGHFFRVGAHSMEPTIMANDRVYIQKHSYKNTLPKNNDIIVFSLPEGRKTENQDFSNVSWLSRVVATAGQTVQIKNKKLLINGAEQSEAFTQFIDAAVWEGLENLSPESFQSQWEMGGFLNPQQKSPRDNFGPVTVPQNTVFVMSDNRDESMDSRFFGPVPIDNISGKVTDIIWPKQHQRKFE